VRDRRLRRAVLSRRGCLASLPALERRVLFLRAGVGRSTPRARSSVARIVKRSVTGVRRVERRALVRLRRLAASSSCDSSGSSGSPGSPTYATYSPGVTTTQDPAASAEETGFTPIIDEEPSGGSRESSGGSAGSGGGRKLPREKSPEAQPDLIPPPVIGMPRVIKPGGAADAAPIIGLALVLLVGGIAITGVRKGWPGFG
jgi:hypothetical protein